MLSRAAMPSLSHFALSSLLLCTLFFSAPVAANFITLYPDQPGSINMTYYTDENYLYVTVTHAYFSWIGIGWHAASDRFGDPSAMYNADYIIAQFYPNGTLMNVLDYVTDPTSGDGETQPVLDTSLADKGCTNDVTTFAGFANPVGTSISFQRLLKTNDAICDHPISNATQLVVWACGAAPGDGMLGFHGMNPSTHGAVQLNFMSSFVPPPPPKPTYDLAPLHGSLMFVAFGVLMSFGVFVGRYLKRYWWWFPLHIIVQLIAIAVIIAAFACALKMVNGVHFSSVHSKIGFTAICLTAIAPFLGIISDRMYDPKRTSLPWWPDYTHWISGRLALFFGWAAIILGILLIGIDKSVAIAAGGLFAIYVLLYFATDLMKRVAGNDYTPAGSDPINAPMQE